MLKLRTFVSAVLGFLLIAGFALPAQAAATHEEQEYAEDTVDCVHTHLVNGWWVGNCLERPPTLGNAADTVECLEEHKNHLKHALLCFPR